MAQFIGYLSGMRGDVSRLGSKDSGLQASANGWSIGGAARVHHERSTERDSVSLDLDSGSGYEGHRLGFGPFYEHQTSTEHMMQALRNIAHQLDAIAEGNDYTNYASKRISLAGQRHIGTAARQLRAAIRNMEKAEPGTR